MRGFLHHLEQQREPRKQWKQNVPRYRSWRRFIAGKDPRAASRTVLFHQNLLMVLGFHMYLREWWMARVWWLMEEILRRWVGTWVWAVLLVCRSRSFPSGHRQPLEDFFFMFDRLYFFRGVLNSQQYWREDTEISHIHPALTYAQPPSLSTSHTRGAQMMNLHWHILILQILLFVLGLTLDVVYPVDKFMMAYTYDYSIQCNFIAFMFIIGLSGTVA